MKRRFEMWAGRWIPEFIVGGNDITLWPVVDAETCGKIDGSPRPEQVLCWAADAPTQALIASLLEKHYAEQKKVE